MNLNRWSGVRNSSSSGNLQDAVAAPVGHCLAEYGKASLPSVESRIRERVCSCPCVEHKLSEYREARPTKTSLLFVINCLVKNSPC